jgi:hypothetical protein
MTNLIEYANMVMTKYPKLSGDVKSLVQLCIDEIEEGSPESHEIQLCWSDIEELVKEEEASILTRNI